MRVLSLYVFLAILQFTNLAQSKKVDYNPAGIVQEFKSDPMRVIDSYVRETHTFYGLASYYNNINYYLISKGSISSIPEGEAIRLHNKEWLVIAGRFNVLAINARDLTFEVSDEKLLITNPDILTSSNCRIIPKLEMVLVDKDLDKVRYAHLWFPIRWLSICVEDILNFIHQNVSNSWAISIIIFALLLRLLLLPASLYTAKLQRHVDYLKSQLIPKIAEIKTDFEGAELHEKIMEAHKKCGVSPFYTLKPIMGPLIQIPLLIAIFNAMGEMSQLDAPIFYSFGNWSYPDSILKLPFTIPLFGNEVNLLPCLMTAITVFSATFFQNNLLPKGELKKQMRNLYLMAFGFFILFYSFPAAMVFFWLLASIFQTLLQQLSTVSRPKAKRIKLLSKRAVNIDLLSQDKTHIESN